MPWKLRHAMAVCLITLLPTLSLAQWQGSDFYQPLPPTLKGSGSDLNKASSAIELIKPEQAARQRDEQQRDLQSQKTKLDMEMLQQQLTELQKKVALQENAMRKMTDSSRHRGAENK